MTEETIIISRAIKGSFKELLGEPIEINQALEEKMSASLAEENPTLKRITDILNKLISQQATKEGRQELKEFYEKHRPIMMVTLIEVATAIEKSTVKFVFQKLMLKQGVSEVQTYDKQ